MGKAEYIKETQEFIAYIKKCIADSTEIESKYKDALIESFKDNVEDVMSMSEEEFEEEIKLLRQKIEEANMSGEDLDNLTAKILSETIDTQIKEYKKYEEKNNE